MKKTILALSLCAAAGLATAQATAPAVAPLVATQATKANPAPGASQVEYLNAMLQQLIQLNMAAQQLKPIAPACSYEDKSYSEGAIRQVGKVSLVCVERDWGIKSFESNDVKAPRELVWEPVGSQRLATYRKATGLGDK